MNYKYTFTKVFLSVFSMLAIVAVVQFQPMTVSAQTSTPTGGGGGSIPVTQTSNATVVVNGTPVLALTYNSLGRQAMLTATFNISVNGGDQGVYIYKNNAVVNFVGPNGNGSTADMVNQTRVITPVSSVSTVTDQYGNTLYIVRARQIATFRVTGSVNPALLFAGSYYATLSGLFANSSLSGTYSFELPVPTNRTNAKTIVGEISPYITSVTSPITPGQKMTILGQRLSGASIFIDNNPLPGVVIIGSTNGTSLSFTYPSPVSVGGHSLYVNTANGQSNIIGFQVGDKTGPANISLDASSPLASTVVVTDTTNGNYLNLPVLVFDVGAQGGTLNLKSLSAAFSTSGNGTLSAAYLYEGSTLIASAVVSNIPGAVANFGTLIPPITIPDGSQIPLTIKVDVSNVSGSGFTVSGNINPIAVGLQDSAGNSIVPTGLVQGNTITVVGKGPAVSIAGTPTISTQNITPGGAVSTTWQTTATFNVNVTAVGESVTLGLPTSANPAFGNTSTSANLAETYVNGVPSPISGMVASYSAPSNTISSTNGTFTIAQNQTVTIPVTYTFVATGNLVNTCAIVLKGMNYSALGANGFVSVPNNPSAFTPSVSCPLQVSTQQPTTLLSIAQTGSKVINGITLNVGVNPAGGTSNMQVNSISVDFNTRAWLYFSHVSLVNNATGQVIATSNHQLSPSDFTEIVAGQDYRYVFSGLNFTVQNGQTVILDLGTISASGVSTTNSSYYANTAIISASVRAVDGNGVTQTATESTPSLGGGVQVSNTSATLVGSQGCTAGVANNIVTSCNQPFTMTFTLTAGNYPVYISNAGAAITPCPSGLTCTTNGPLVFSSAGGSIFPITTSFSASPTSMAGDRATYYTIPPGSSRTFTYNGYVTNAGLSAGVYTVQVSSIRYGTSPTNLTSNSITSSLQNLQVTVQFNGGTTQQPTITISSPTSGTFNVGSGIPITFTTSGLAGQAIQISFNDVSADASYGAGPITRISTDGMQTVNEFIPTTVPAGTYTITMSSTICNNESPMCVAMATSNGSFTITNSSTQQPTIVLTSPINSTWHQNSSYTVSWTTTGNIVTERLYYYPQGGSLGGYFAGGNFGGQYTFTTANLSPGQYSIEIQGLDSNNNVVATTNGSFTIISKSIVSVPIITTFSTPDAVTLGGSLTITWNTVNATSCTLTDTSKGGALSGYIGPVAVSSHITLTNLSNDDVSSFPDTVTLKCTGSAGLTTQKSNVIGAYSPTITTHTPPTITSPIFSDIWLKNTPHPIAVTATGNVDLTLVSQSGTTYPIQSNVSNYTWMVGTGGSYDKGVYAIKACLTGTTICTTGQNFAIRSATKFTKGSRVQVTPNDDGDIPVYATPGGSQIGTQPNNSQGTIIDWPQPVNGLDNFQHVNFDSGVDGWVDDFLLMNAGANTANNTVSATQSSTNGTANAFQSFLNFLGL